MPNYKDLINLLETALSEEILDEKIMSKKKARLLKKKKALAQKRAEEEKRKEQEKVIEPEIVDDKEENKEERDFKPLVTYDNKLTVQEEEQKDYSEAFKKFIQSFNELIQKYSPDWDRANQIWEQAGKDKACPKEAYDLFKQTIENVQKDFQDLMEGQLPQYIEELSEPELNYIEMQATAINKFLEDYGKAIESLHPELLDVDDKEITDLVPVDKELPVSTDKQLPATTDQQDQQNDQDDQEKGIEWITFEQFEKLTRGSKQTWKSVTEAEKELASTSWPEFIKKLNPLDWFEDRVWSFINSPLMNDIIKTLMYSNPITAMIYDGKLGNFGIKSGLEKIRAQREKQRATRDKKKAEKNKKPEDFYNEKGIPKDISKLKISELRAEFYGNKNFVGFLNTAYNHPETDNNDAMELEKYADNINKQFMKGNTFKELDEVNRTEVVKNFTALITKLNEIADYQHWDDKESFEQAMEEAGLNKEGRADSTAKKKNSEANKKINAINNLIKAYKNDNQKKWTDTEIADKITDKYSDVSMDKALEYVKNYNDKNESYNIITKLNKLLETAEA